ncbi:response regulator [Pseudomonas monteilii]|nr:response regulator [Pseudomonas monteilii]
MNDIHSPVRKLAKTSLRLNVFLVVSILLVIVLIFTCFWSFLRLVEDQEEIVEFHFKRLMGNIHSHEDFLEQLARRTDDATRRLDQATIPLQYKLLERSSRITLYEGREFSFSLPFNLAVREERAEEMGQKYKGILSLGVMLSNVYSSYWTTSRYPATQVFLLDMQAPVSLAVPAMDAIYEAGGSERDHYLQAVEKIREHVRAEVAGQQFRGVHWAKAGQFFGQGVKRNRELELIAFTHAVIPRSLWLQESAPTHVIAVSLLDLPRLNEFMEVLKRPIFDGLELRSPEGEILAGKVDSRVAIPERYAIARQGLFIRITSDDGWAGVYQIGFDTLLHYAKWHLLLLGSLVLLIIIGGILSLRRYISRVVLPADEAHRYVVESDAFSGLIIETGQVGIFVVRQSDGSVVLENRLACEWLSGSEQVLNMSREWRIVKSDHNSALTSGEGAQIHVNGRFLQVGFAQTRYHGQDVTLCTLQDITTHRLTEEKLEEAKRSADAANEAKTVFLATMSHEIRTPLYGLLGTLELLGLTELSAQQRDYLKTMQHSSSSLLQLISDILDVSKIESGQMPLEEVEFSPLDLIEELMRTYSAAATGKGLQFYACVDTNVPQKVVGDAAKIRQILGNLISNAIKFTDIGRVVLRLRASIVQRDNVNLEWQVSDSGEGILRDHQAHLFEPFYQVLGEHRTMGGTGLGLSICSRLSELMGGRIELVSEVGLGSSFTLILSLASVEESGKNSGPHLMPETVFVRSPVRDLAVNLSEWLIRWGADAVIVRVDEVPPVSPGAVLLDLLPDALPKMEWPNGHVVCVTNSLGSSLGSITASVYSLREIGQAVRQAQKGEPLVIPSLGKSQGHLWHKLGLRALVAEDNPFNQNLLKEQLEELGCTVRICPDGREALLAWRSGEFDVLLTDVNMPVINGYELAAEVRAADPNMPIIGVTANAMKEEGERCISVGMNAWLVKPLSLGMLYEGLCKVCSIVPPTTDRSTLENKGSIDLTEKTKALMLEVITEDINLARACIASEDIAGTLDKLHRIRGSWAIAQGGELLDSCLRVECLLAEQANDEDAFRAALAVLDKMEMAVRSC